MGKENKDSDEYLRKLREFDVRMAKVREQKRRLIRLQQMIFNQKIELHPTKRKKRAESIKKLKALVAKKEKELSRG